MVIAALVISYRVAQADFGRLFRDLPKDRDLVVAFPTPDLISRDTKTRTIAIAFPIPCGTAPEEANLPGSGPRLVPSVGRASPSEKFTLEGFDLQPDMDFLSSEICKRLT